MTRQVRSPTKHDCLPTNRQSEINSYELCRRAAFLRDGPPSLAQRQVDLETLKQAILSHRDRLVEAVNEDFGHRSHQETSYMDLMRQHQYPETAAKYITTFIRTTK